MRDMPSEPEKLDTESLLLLYLADELPADQRLLIESRLAREPELAAQFESLRDLQTGLMESIRQDDQTSRMPVNEAVAVRRVSRAMEQWQVDRLAIRSVDDKPRRSIPLWAYPAAVAAMIIVGFLTWSMRQEIKPVGPERPMVSAGGDEEQMADWLASSFGATPDGAEETQPWLPAELPGMDDRGSLMPAIPEETVQ